MIELTENYIRGLFHDVGYEPTEAQWPIHLDKHRIKLIGGGWRAGKSTVGEKEIVKWLPTMENDLVWIIGPDYEQCRQEFEYLLVDMDIIKQLKRDSFPQQGPCAMVLHNGTTIATKSADDPVRLGSKAPGLILMCEAAQQPYEVWLRVRGRAIEKRAPIILHGTFEGSLGWYPEKFLRWQVENDENAKSFSLPSWTNTARFPGGRLDPEIVAVEKTTPPDRFSEFYGGLPCKPSNVILPEFTNTIHVKPCPYDPDIPVEIAVDPGYGIPGAYAVVPIQCKNGDIYCLTEIYKQHLTSDDIILKAKKDWKFFSAIKGGTIDIYGEQHHAMPPAAKPWRDAGVYLESRKIQDLEKGIDTLRTWLKVHPETGRPNLFVDPSCRGGISEAGGGDSPVEGGGPWLRHIDTGKEIDRNNHFWKAIMYFLLIRFGYMATIRETNYGKVFRIGKRIGGQSRISEMPNLVRR